MISAKELIKANICDKYINSGDFGFLSLGLVGITNLKFTTAYFLFVLHVILNLIMAVTKHTSLINYKSITKKSVNSGEFLLSSELRNS